MRPTESVPTIALDLDGVMADLSTVIRAHLGFKHKILPSSLSFLWLRHIPHLFAELPLLPGALEMFHALSHNNIYILTARPWPIGNFKTARIDKRDWVHKKLDQNLAIKTIMGGGDKGRFAQPGHVLIDDLPRNIRNWEKKGGIGILHKSPKETLIRCEQLGLLKEPKQTIARI